MLINYIKTIKLLVINLFERRFDMATKKYILTIEFNEDEDRCEYIEERIVIEAPEEDTTLYEVDIEDYFSELGVSLMSGIIAEA